VSQFDSKLYNQSYSPQSLFTCSVCHVVCRGVTPGVCVCVCVWVCVWCSPVVHVTWCVEIDECAATPPVCGPHSNCTNTPGSYQCTCHAGFRRDGTLCTGKCRTIIAY